MQRLTVGKYLHKRISDDSEERDREEIGLFTFYRQQEEEEDILKAHFNNLKREKTKKSKLHAKHQGYGLNKSSIQTKPNVGQDEKTDSKCCQKFLKSLAPKTYKFNCRTEEDPQITKKLVSSKSNEGQLKLQQVQQDEQASYKGLIKDINQVNKYNMVLQSDKGFVPRPLKRIEELLQICNQKASNINERQDKSKSPIPKKEQIWVNNTIEEQRCVKDVKIQKLISNNFRKTYRILLENADQERDIVKSLQKSFLQKVRLSNPKKQDQKQRSRQNFSNTQKEGVSPKQVSCQNLKGQVQKQIQNSRTNQNLHDENKKYFCSLINNFYLPQNQHSQAAKMLRDTLKFPNLIVNNYNLKTEASEQLSPTRTIRDQLKSISCRKGNLAKIKPTLPQSESETLKPNLNERFKFLLRKQRTNNSFYKPNKLRAANANERTMKQ